MNKLKLGVIGFGSFGEFMVSHLCEYFSEINIYDIKTNNSAILPAKTSFTSLENTLQADIIILAIPVQFLEKFLASNSKFFNPKALVIDVCSVKTIPTELMLKYLPDSIQILASHPLFGKYSGKNGIKGLKIMLFPVRLDMGYYQKIKNFISDKLELEIIETTPEQHDKQMAYVQALTFFIGKSISGLEIPNTILKTPTYQYLLNIKEVVGSDTNDLFFTIQNFNPFAKSVRQEFVDKLTEIEDIIQAQ